MKLGKLIEKESGFEVSPKGASNSRVVSFVFNDYMGLSQFLLPLFGR